MTIENLSTDEGFSFWRFLGCVIRLRHFDPSCLKNNHCKYCGIRSADL